MRRMWFLVAEAAIPLSREELSDRAERPGGLKPGLGPYGTCPEGHDVKHVFQDETRRV